MSSYKGKHRARSNRFSTERMSANRFTVRHATWQDVPDFLLLPSPRIKSIATSGNCNDVVISQTAWIKTS
jgi:hypothetical protein